MRQEGPPAAASHPSQHTAPAPCKSHTPLWHHEGSHHRPLSAAPTPTKEASPTMKLSKSSKSLLFEIYFPPPPPPPHSTPAGAKPYHLLVLAKVLQIYLSRWSISCLFNDLHRPSPSTDGIPSAASCITLRGTSLHPSSWHDHTSTTSTDFSLIKDTTDPTRRSFLICRHFSVCPSV